MGDLIDRAQAMTELQMSAKRLTLAYEAHGEGRVEYSDIIIRLSDALDTLRGMPSAEPEQRWIPVTERLPENDNEVLITVWDAEDDYVEVYKGFYQEHEWWTQWCHGCSKIKDEPCGENIVIAWMSLPEPYEERREE